MAIKPKRYFLVKDGTAIKNLFELAKTLDDMPEDVFRHHVNESKNDFYNWIKDVIRNKRLAEKILSIKDRKQMQKIIGEDIQKKVLKNMGKKPVIKTPRKMKTERKMKTDAKHIQKNSTSSNKKESAKIIQNIKEKLQNLVKTEKSAAAKYPKVDPEGTRFGMDCPYKTFHCGALEFVFGIIIGLLTALVITNII